MIDIARGRKAGVDDLSRHDPASGFSGAFGPGFDGNRTTPQALAAETRLRIRLKTKPIASGHNGLRPARSCPMQRGKQADPRRPLYPLDPPVMTGGATIRRADSAAPLALGSRATEPRRKLLAGLDEKGFGRDALQGMQRIIDAQSCDLFDVLAYVAFKSNALSREERAAAARAATAGQYTDRQRAFVDFVLAQYVSEGVDELDTEKLAPLLKLRYHNALPDAFSDLGPPEKVRAVFVGFQRYLYQAGSDQTQQAR